MVAPPIVISEQESMPNLQIFIRQIRHVRIHPSTFNAIV